MTGFICLNKHIDVSSFGAIAEIRRILGVKKIGHTGTLDPIATGVLPLALGQAARFISLLPFDDKAYTARLKFGITTDTLDITGRVLSERQPVVSREELKECLKAYRGIIKQVPPMFSAIHKDGVRLYELARQGIEVEREEREVEIKSLELMSFENNMAEIHVECSKGTYIRSLIGDIGESLGCGAVMTALIRTKSNGFSLENSLTADEIRTAFSEGLTEDFIIPVEKVFSPYKKIAVTSAQSIRFQNGGELDTKRLPSVFKDGIYRVFSQDDRFLGLGEINKKVSEDLRPIRILNS